MLISIDMGEVIDKIPHQQSYDLCRARLTDAQYDAIMDELARRIEGREVNCSSFIPGEDWTGTPFMPIWEDACNQDHDAARRFFGLLVWEFMMNHADKWGFGRYNIRGVEVEGMVYFRLDG